MPDAGASLTVSPRSPIIGADIHGVDLSAELDDGVIAAIRSALLKHNVIFFHGQSLTPARQTALARRFGEVLHHPARGFYPESDDGLIVMDQIPDETFRINGKKVIGSNWHMDNLFMETPPLGTILYAERVPDSGGDTCFASLGAAYDSFSPAFRSWLDGLTALNSLAGFQTGGTAEVDGPHASVHPVVRVDPETGRRMFNVSSNWTQQICELDPIESKAVLDLIYQRIATRPDFQCRFKWREGSVAFWDNRAVHHYAVGDYTSQRTMHRVMIAGERPRGVGGLAGADVGSTVAA